MIPSPPLFRCGIQEIWLGQFFSLRKKIIWNFGRCTSLTLRNVDVVGTVLAPFATLTPQSRGHVTGQVVVNGWEDAAVEVSLDLFEGCGIPFDYHPTSSSSSSSTTTTSTGECPGREVCHNGGVLNADCQCECVDHWSGSDCTGMYTSILTLMIDDR